MTEPSLDSARIAQTLTEPARTLLGPIKVIQETDSTNDILHTTPDDVLAATLLAHRQRAGRGRQGRRWESTEGALCFSVLHTFPAPPSALALWVGIALAERLREMGLGQPGLSWPNDLVYGAEKFGGILTECRARADRVRCVVGVGVNVTAAPVLERPVASIAAACGQTPDPNALAAALLEGIAECLADLDAGSKNGLVAHFARYDSLQNRMVEVTETDRTYTGRACGVDDDGRMRVEGEQGIRCFDSADVRLHLS